MSRDGRLRTTSLRLRTVVAILVLLAVLLAGLVVAVEAVLGARLTAQVADRLRDRTAAAAALVGVVDANDLADRLSAQGLSVRIVEPDGAAVEAGPTPDQLRKGPPDPGGLPGPGKRSSSAGTSDTTAADGATTTASGSGSGTTIASSTLHDDDGVLTLRSDLEDGTRITLTAGTRDVQATLAQLGWVMGGASAAFLGVAVVGVVLVARRSLRPLDELTATARSIAAGDRGRRLRPARTDTEIGRVALALDEMLDAVEGAEAQAVAAEERVRSFLSDAAHELRTPVAGVRAAADTLVRNGPDDPATNEVLAVHVVRQADRAARLVDDMLTMARLDRGIVLDRRPTDLTAWLTAEAERLRIRLHGVDLRTVVPDHPVTADVDPDRLAQVLGNLVDNAARATGRVRTDGDITAAGRSAAGTVEVALRPDADTVVLRVEDDGPGIPTVDRERVFDRLVRLEDARDAHSGGAGLGLPIARGIATAHGGSLRHAAETGGAPRLGGAAFELRLPAVEPVPPVERPAAAVLLA
ncbi:two-component sensor histidine kinase [Curtobacterium sp. 'Ferrero']|uniref:sensor histidine kinase n=1 Tax=Curtobacterium sp. 'Ferrero' TaxID=2033654 RepID=UPI000BC7BC10|nr:HAMP domain-containing sensor histidine kinase [Curtobacterium sp. 'Ferrero']PCN46404.1 two-component sensor histidine kinase [Curtobacterium sp. 'Ferrero']